MLFVSLFAGCHIISPFKPLLQGSGADLIRVLSFVLPLGISLYADKTSILFSPI
jgi:hypothetical protein